MAYIRVCHPLGARRVQIYYPETLSWRTSVCATLWALDACKIAIVQSSHGVLPERHPAGGYLGNRAKLQLASKAYRTAGAPLFACHSIHPCMPPFGRLPW